MMKKYLILFIIGFSLTSYAQFKNPGFSDPSVKDGITSNSGNSLFGFLNSENFSMNHSYSMSYTGFGGGGLALGVYTNSMFYKFANNLNVQLDASFVHSPYSSFGTQFQKDITGFYISKAAVNYQPWKDVNISFQYRNLPYNAYSPYGYNRGYSPFDSYNPFFD